MIRGPKEVGVGVSGGLNACIVLEGVEGGSGRERYAGRYLLISLLSKDSWVSVTREQMLPSSLSWLWLWTYSVREW